MLIRRRRRRRRRKRNGGRGEEERRQKERRRILQEVFDLNANAYTALFSSSRSVYAHGRVGQSQAREK